MTLLVGDSGAAVFCIGQGHVLVTGTDSYPSSQHVLALDLYDNLRYCMKASSSITRWRADYTA